MIKELRIVIVEDMPSDVMMVNHELRQSGLLFRSTRIETRDEFVRELERQPPDIILSDHGVPGFDGFAALETARRICPAVPFIFVTGANSDEKMTETLDRGATDYVLKKNLNQLGDAIQKALESREADSSSPKPASAQVFPPDLPEVESPPSANRRDRDSKEWVLFVKKLAADLRAPARQIENAAELALKSPGRPLEANTLRQLRTISESAHKVNQLLDALESFSPGSGRRFGIAENTMQG